MRRLKVDDDLLPCAYVLKCSIENELHKVSATSAEHDGRRVSRATRVTAVHVYLENRSVCVCV